jgi:hypothetical protein
MTHYKGKKEEDNENIVSKKSKTRIYEIARNKVKMCVRIEE